MIKTLDHLPTRIALEAERAFLTRLGGGCLTPIGALAKIEGSRLTLMGMIASPDGKVIFREKIEGSPEEAKKLGIYLAESMLKQGASAIIV